eukprot:1156221-Pelagomonas_calceolata.AAC.18
MVNALEGFKRRWSMWRRPQSSIQACKHLGHLPNPSPSTLLLLNSRSSRCSCSRWCSNCSTMRTHNPAAAETSSAGAAAARAVHWKFDSTFLLHLRGGGRGVA